ncbi:unnamed protein product, partial [Dibothriocephalus latus]
MKEKRVLPLAVDQFTPKTPPLFKVVTDRILLSGGTVRRHLEAFGYHHCASIRRSSMREKAKLSWKEARLEAETCSLVVSTEDGACVQEETKAPVWMT